MREMRPLGRTDSPIGERADTGGWRRRTGDTPHRYQFTVYALDEASLGLDPQTTYARFRFAIKDHVLAAGSLVGRFGLEGSS
jgi:phosphatidylethanolamine-binding protein (PEBP) family uncharacterized protein